MDTIDFSKIEKTKFELSTRIFRCVIIYLDKNYDRATVDKFLLETGLDRKYLTNEHNWISFDYYNLALEKLVQFTGNPRVPFDSGYYMLAKESYGVIYSLFIVLKIFSSPKMLYKKIVDIGPSLSNIGKYSIISLKKNKVTFKVQLFKKYKQTKLNCLALQGQLSSIPVVWNLPPARVKELACAVDGDDACIYEFTWLPRSFKTNLLSIIAFLGFSIELMLFFLN